MANTDARVLQLFLGSIGPEHTTEMTGRAKQLVTELQDLTISDFGISSVEALGLLKKVEAEFGVEIPPEEAEKLGSLQALTEYIEARR